MRVEDATAVPPTLHLSDADLDPAVRNRLEARDAGDFVLGQTDAIRQSVFDAVPAAIARRVKRMMPPDFEVSEICLEMNLGGTLLGAAVGGKVEIKYGPRRSGPVGDATLDG